MLRCFQDLVGCSIGATDGQIGEVEDFYFDDFSWTMRYLVVETGLWLKRRKVLISPLSLGQPEWQQKRLPASITTEQVQASPDIDTKKPVSRQHEAVFLTHYRHTRYWEAAGPRAVAPNPNVRVHGAEFAWSDDHFSMALAAQESQQSHDPLEEEQHLRSCNAILKYRVRAGDEDIGQVQGVLFSDEDWCLRYLIVKTGNWWNGHEILIAVQWIYEVNWLDSSISARLSRQTLVDAPVYDSSVPLERSGEIKLFKYYGKAGYWSKKSETNPGGSGGG